MDTLIAIVLFILFTVLSRGKEERRQQPPSWDGGSSSDFEIPPIIRAPSKDAEGTESVETLDDEIENLESILRDFSPQNISAHDFSQPDASTHPVDEKPSVSTKTDVLTPNAALYGVVYAEILGKPKAYRRRRF